MRDKHIIHDENALAQSGPAAILNHPDAAPKIAKVFCMTLVSETLEQASYDPLQSLISAATTWVSDEFDRLCDELQQDLETQPYEQLANCRALDFQLAKYEDIGRSR